MADEPDLPSRPQLADRAHSGIRWTTLALAANLAIGAVLSVVLARLIAPAEYGLLAMTVVVTSFLTLFRDFGLVSALVQRANVDDDDLHTMFWLNGAFGAAAGLVLAALGPVTAWFFGEPRLALILAVLGFNSFLQSFGGVRRALLTRRMKFDLLSRNEVQSGLTGGIIAIVLAFQGFGVWALVAQSMARTISSNLLLYGKLGYRPRLRFSEARAKEMLSYGMHTTNTGVLGYVYRNLDNILVGRYLGATSLAFYSLGFRLFRMPMQQARSVLTRVMFPTLVAARADLDQFRGLYRQGMRYMTAGLVPGFAILHVAAPLVIPLVFGPRWVEVVPILRILALAGLSQSLLLPSGWIYQAMGRMDLAFRNSLVWGLIPVSVALFVGVQFGLEGAAWAVLASSVFVVYPGLRVPLGLIGLRPLHNARDVAPIFLAAAPATLAGYILVPAFAAWLPAGPLYDAVALAAVCATMGVMYVTALWLVAPLLLRALVRVARSILLPKGMRVARPPKATGP